MVIPDQRHRDEIMLERAQRSMTTGEWVSINSTSGVVESIDRGDRSYCVRMRNGYGRELQFISFPNK